MPNDYRLYLGDCLDIMPTLEAQSVDLIFADLPYGTTEMDWDKRLPLDIVFGEYRRLIKPDGVIGLTATQPYAAELIMFAKDLFKYDWIWEKDAPVNRMQAHYRPLTNHEHVLIFSLADATPNQFAKIKMKYFPQDLKPFGKRVNGMRKGEGATSTNRGHKANYLQTHTNYPRSVLHFDIARPRLHATQKPLALMEYLILTYSNPGDVVLDNTMGSGTTGEAAIRTGRKFIGIEKEPEFYRIAETRLRQAQPPLLTGEQ